MKRSIVLLALFGLSTAAIVQHYSIAQEKARVIPAAPPASAETLTKLVESGAYQYGVSIRSTSGDEKLRFGGPDTGEPNYSGVAVPGIESCAGIPLEVDGKQDDELCSLCYKIKATAIDEETVRVKLTVAYSSDAVKQDSVVTWNEQVWTSQRDIRLNETNSVSFVAPENKNVPGFEVHYRVRKFDGRLPRPRILID